MSPDYSAGLSSAAFFARGFFAGFASSAGAASAAASSALGFAAFWLCGLGRSSLDDHRRVDPFDEAIRRRRSALAELDDAGVAALARRSARCDLGEELFHGVLLAAARPRSAAGMERLRSCRA